MPMDRAAATTSAPAVVFHDGLGERRRIVDATGQAHEVLCLREELTTVPAFEFALRERVSRLASFRHAYYGRVRGVERLKDPATTLVLVSEASQGVRLSELLSVAEKRGLTLDINAALCLIRQLVPAVAVLHEHAADIAHGAIGPERLIVTPHARLMIVEYVLGAALEQLRYSNERYWKELRIALPRSPGLPRFDSRADVAQVGMVALSLILGRPLHDDEYPAQISDVLASAWAISARGDFEPLPPGLRSWLSRALQLDVRQAFSSILEARTELDKVLAADNEYMATPAALEPFLTQYQATLDPLAASETAAAPEKAEPIVVSMERKPEPPAAPKPAPEPAVQMKTEPVQVKAEPVQPKAEEAPVRNAAPVQPKFESPIEVHTPDVAREAEVAWPSPKAKAEPPAPPTPAPKPIEKRPTFESRIEPVAASTAKPLAPSAPKPAPRHEPEPEFDALTVMAQHAAQAQAAAASAVREPAHASSGPNRKRQLLIAAVVVAAVSAAGVPMARRYFSAAPAAAAATGTVIINSNPSGLQVFVDGEAHGVTPLNATLKAGNHTIELRGAGEARVIPIVLPAGMQVSQYIEMPKQRGAASGPGQLQVKTEPAGAQVTVDGVAKGTSPITIKDLAPGSHTVALSSDAGSVTQTVSVESGATASLVVPLGAQAATPSSGWVTVVSPYEVQILEGGKLLGSSQTDRLMVPSGNHQLELVNEALGFRVVRSVQVPPGKVANVAVKPPSGTIALNAIPWADVYIDGERVGETPIGNLQIPIGTHEVVFKNPDLGEQHQTATVTLTTPARLSVDMRKK